jgi:hypothetical protein
MVILSRIYTKNDGEDWRGVWVPGEHTDSRDSSIFDETEVQHIRQFNDPRNFEGYSKFVRRYPSENELVFDLYFDTLEQARAYFIACRDNTNTPLDTVIDEKIINNMIPVYQKSWKLFNAANGAEYPLTSKGYVP